LASCQLATLLYIFDPYQTILRKYQLIRFQALPKAGWRFKEDVPIAGLDSRLDFGEHALLLLPDVWQRKMREYCRQGNNAFSTARSF